MRYQVRGKGHKSGAANGKDALKGGEVVPAYFIRFDLRGGDRAIMEMQARFALRHGMGLEAGIRSKQDLMILNEFLGQLPGTPDLAVHIRRGREYDFYLSDDDAGRNREYVRAALALFEVLPGTACIVHDETDPHARTLSPSRMEAYIDSCRALDPQLARLGKRLYVEFSGSLHAPDYLRLMEGIRAGGVENVGACIDTGHVYYYFRKKRGQSRGQAVESLGRFIGEVRATGVPVTFHVHDCEPGYSHPRYHVSDHLPVGEGEIGRDGFSRIAGYLAGAAVTIEILPPIDPQGAALTGEEVRHLAAYAEAHGIRERREMQEGRIMKRTLAAMAESRRILDGIIAGSSCAVR